ncbi:heat-inducible transcriptional repressor HrcA [Niameybacter massiliensis]|uniref:Heat-inducible transcription repressor HrcA n=1 Tax=Holtiella tumoricola TaxID=3018743 RepID=A0AA42J2S4_9FIRM|nr:MULTISPECIES: heat-inducible transcriptional repressor HrcA [Lachnospirales]MDA3733625.1 heat-inducible transcriptional repressor HrcA [Holtiella tumoricola]
MDINERKRKILEAIVHDYIQTGDPVGSRTISKKYDLGVSSATIRNDMADLEDLGLIMQPHTSAGRIPSDKGYRLYVDNLMQCPDIAPDVQQFIAEVINNKFDKIDKLLEETAKLISAVTHYATIASPPTINQTKIKHLQLVPVDDRSVALVVVTDTNIVRHYVIRTKKLIDYSLCGILTNIINESLIGTSLDELSVDKLRILEERMFGYKDISVDLMNAIIDTLEMEDVPNIFTRGMTNILSFQEFNDIEKAKKLLEVLEQKPYLVKMLKAKPTKEVSISIGEENGLEPMSECSVITTSYDIGEYNLGTIGIIGPKRMNYGQVVSLLDHISYHIQNMLIEAKE